MEHGRENVAIVLCARQSRYSTTISRLSVGGGDKVSTTFDNISHARQCELLSLRRGSDPGSTESNYSTFVDEVSPRMRKLILKKKTEMIGT